MKNIVTKEEMLNFIFSQPRERKVDMDESNIFDPCGCLGVQYSREIWGVESSCGWSMFNMRDGRSAALEENFSFFSFVPGGPESNFTYGEIQDYVKIKFDIKEEEG